MSDLEKFRQLGISEQTLKALAKKGFEEPSPIQTITIPLLLSGEKDIMGQAQTGTGKTAAFGIPIIEKLHHGKKNVQAIILAPTRELAIQIAEEMNSLKGEKVLEIVPIYGGQSIDMQLSRLHRGVDIVVGENLWLMRYR
jgi:ATP-dependent RNA helicase DeaD